MRWGWIIAVIVVLLGGWFGITKYQANQAAEAARVAAEEKEAADKAAAEATAAEEAAAAKAAEEAAAAKAAEEAAAAKAAEEAAAAKAAEEAAAKAAEEAAAAAATSTADAVVKVFKSGEVTADNFAEALASADIDEATKTTLSNAFAKAQGNAALMPYLVTRLNALLPQ